MLVSILLATRNRVPRLLKTIQSIYNTAKSRDFEILLRIDDDDHETLQNLHLLKPYPEVSYIIGSRYEGYISHPIFMDELVAIAKGEWFFFFDDDTTILGEDWDKQLVLVPTSGKIVHPEFYWLGPSKYPSGSCNPVALCVPNKCWEQYGMDKLQLPIDKQIQELLIANGWTNHWLKDIIAFHERDDDETLAEHRTL
jgi:glycosyltransferase involved in cell wall biosynthesis